MAAAAEAVEAQRSGGKALAYPYLRLDLVLFPYLPLAPLPDLTDKLLDARVP